MSTTSSADLAIFTPSLGLLSETFIERHCRDLAPRSTWFGTFNVARADEAWPQGSVEILSNSPRPSPPLTDRLRARLTGRRFTLAQEAWPAGDAATALLLERLERSRPRAVLVEYLDRWLDVLEPIAAMGLRVVAHGHGYDFSRSLRNAQTAAAYRSQLRHAHATIVPSAHAARRLEACGVPNVTVVPYGIPPGPAPRLTAHAGPAQIVAVGRLVEKKDPLGLIDAFAVARETGANIELDLYGDGDLRDAVVKRIGDRGVAGSVRMHGARPHREIIAAIRQADVFVQRSVTAADGNEEGLPLAILEAMAAGLPVVSTLHAGIPEAVVNGSTGTLCDEHDTSAIAAALHRYAADVDRRLQHGRAGRERLESQFTWDRNREALRQVLGLSG